jgi:hypothetical protein
MVLVGTAMENDEEWQLALSELQTMEECHLAIAVLCGMFSGLADACRRGGYDMDQWLANYGAFLVSRELNGELEDPPRRTS